MWKMTYMTTLESNLKVCVGGNSALTYAHPDIPSKVVSGWVFFVDPAKCAGVFNAVRTQSGAEFNGRAWRHDRMTP